MNKFNSYKIEYMIPYKQNMGDLQSSRVRPEPGIHVAIERESYLLPCQFVPELFSTNFHGPFD